MPYFVVCDLWDQYKVAQSIEIYGSGTETAQDVILEWAQGYKFHKDEVCKHSLHED